MIDFEQPQHDKMLDKVRALLEKANDAAATDAEREAYTGKAFDLMARYSIEEAVVFASQREAETPNVVQHFISVPKDKAGQTLLGVVCKVTGVKAIFIKPPRYGYNEKPRITQAAVCGYPTDLQMTEVLYTSLLVQMEAAKIQALKGKPSYENGKAFANAFKWGFIATVGRRLDEVHAEAVSDVPGAALVLHDKSDRVQKFFETMHPHTVKGSPVAAPSSASGYNSGAEAGNRAKIDRSPLRENVTSGAPKAVTA